MNTNDIEEILERIRGYEAEIKAAEQKRDDSIAFHQNKIELAKRICDVDTRELREEVTRLSYALEDYYNSNPPRIGKSLKFSGGSFGYRKQEPKFFFENVEVKSDSPEFVAFCKVYYDDYVKTKAYVDWNRFKNNITADDSGVYFKETGEILDGFRAQFFPDKFKVKINE